MTIILGAIIILILYVLHLSLCGSERMRLDSDYEYFNHNGEGVPIQRKHKATGRIQTRTVVGCDGNYNACKWYDSDSSGLPIDKENP